MEHLKRIEFFITRNCINSCVFCSERPKLDGSQLSLKKIKRVLSRERSRGMELVHFVGGEPTVHPDFPAAAAYAKTLGYRVFIVTNVIRFADRSFCECALPFIDDMLISVHGHTAKIHDTLTGHPGAFRKVVKGIELIRKYFRGRLKATSTITNLNYTCLAKIARFIHKWQIDEYQCMSIVPTGQGKSGYFNINPRLNKLKKHLQGVITYCETAGVIIRFSGIPMCILGDKYRYSLDIWEPFKIDNSTSVGGKIELWKKPGRGENFKINLGRVKTGRCRQCAQKKACGGVYHIYQKRYGDKELAPFS